MDQDAFRSLLATPARSSDQGRSPTSSRAPATSRFGIAPPKRALAQSTTKDLATDLKPRKVPKPRRNPDGSLYRDRAAERRAGRDGDFADAEKLLEDFKSRSETAGVSKDVLEDQMKYLGGDEHHSILVKGLDIALLERKKAELAQKAERELDDVEDELDAAFNENPVAPPLSGGVSPPPRPSTSTARAGVGSGSGGGAEPTLAKRKKTRDELIAEMKAMRAGQAAAAAGAAKGASDGGAGGGASESRFKPIGSTSTDNKKGKGKETASGGGWKTVGGAGDGGGGEKKKRKKRKVVPPTAADQTLPTAPDSATASAPSKELPSSAPVPAPAPAPAPVAEDDDDMDIFGDVGDYKGLDTDEESDAGGGSAAPATSTATSTLTGTGKRKYFDDDDDEVDEMGTSTAPTGIEDLAARQAAANVAAAAAAAGGAGPSAGAGVGGGEEDEARGEDRPMRLEGLSGAGPSVKELLEMDKAAEAEEKRQARKLKAKEKAEARRANMTDADKANQDYQKMMAHLEKKDGGPGGGGGKKHSP
ncbi:hypothetical protein JCM8115_002609 [Rhodotorula mucilaginosa]